MRNAAWFVVALVGHAAVTGADAAKGEDLYARNCLACHVPGPEGGGGPGPRLWKLVGRPAATADEYAYSDALKASRIVWTRKRLDAYIRDPRRVVSGTTMTFRSTDAAERRHILDYLETLR